MAPESGLWTIGYEGYHPQDWVAKLLENGIQLVVDVRAVVHSRKPGFSKAELIQSLDAKGIEYLHADALGTPRSLRQAYHHGLDFPAFAKEYGTILDSDAAKSTLREILDRAAEKRVALMCFEEDPAVCHRSLVAERLRQMQPGLQVTDLRR